MFTNSFANIWRISLTYTLFKNAPNVTRSSINQTLSVDYHHRSQRRGICYKSTLSFDNSLYAITFVNKNLCIVRREVSSQSSINLMKMLNYLPFFASGKIVSGFGRGSKELGIPTANYPLDVVKSLPNSFKPGVYFGWANVDNGPVYKMVMSIGWNPFYENKEKSMETHILHEFNRDLYGCLLKVCIVGYLRPEKNFKSLEDLIACIRNDIAEAEVALESNESYKLLQNHAFFGHTNNGNCKNNIIK